VTRERHQTRQWGDETQWLQHDVCRHVSERLFVAVHDTPLAIDRQALGGDQRAGDIAAQAFQPAPLMGLPRSRLLCSIPATKLPARQNFWSLLY